MWRISLSKILHRKNSLADHGTQRAFEAHTVIWDGHGGGATLVRTRHHHLAAELTQQLQAMRLSILLPDTHSKNNSTTCRKFASASTTPKS
jgi:hypothetical protein